jgi:hypothetical protein
MITAEINAGDYELNLGMPVRREDKMVGTFSELKLIVSNEMVNIFFLIRDMEEKCSHLEGEVFCEHNFQKEINKLKQINDRLEKAIR